MKGQTDRERKYLNIRALWAAESKADTLGDVVAIQRAIAAEHEELGGGVLLVGRAGFEQKLKELIKRRPTWFNYELIEWAHDRRASARTAGEG